MTPSVKRTPKTESLIELEGERQAMYRTVAGKFEKDHVTTRKGRNKFETHCDMLERTEPDFCHE